MKRTAAFLLALCLMPWMVAMGEAQSADNAENGNVVIYTSDFSSGTDGWVARGAQSAAVTAEKTLRVEGRTADWNSAGRTFDLIPGVAYTVSAEVRQDEADSATLMISVEHTQGGTPSWENIVRENAARGQWTTLRGAYTPAAPFDSYVLYVETVGAAELQYEIRNFRLEAPAGTPLTSAEAAAETEALPSLKEAYAGKFDFGAAAPQAAFMSSRLKALMRSQFSILTPENELKPDSVIDWAESRRLVKESGDETACAVHFDAARPLLDFAREEGIRVHGHVLVWHNQTREEFFHAGYDTTQPLLDRETMTARLENYIRGVLEGLEAQYPGVVVSWDVVNEAIDDRTGGLRKSNWYKVIGEDYIQTAFALARKYAPEGTQLYYNDYNTAYSGKRKGIVRLLNTLIAEGTIDGYGFQMHHKVSEPSMTMITSAVSEIAALGLKLRVSELDVGTGGNTEADFEKQAKKYADVMKLMLTWADQTEAVQVWGLTDNMSWRSKEYPLLFDSAGNPKPAFWAVMNPMDQD